MRLTKVFGLLFCAVTTCFAQSTNQLTITGFPLPRAVPMSLDDAVRLALEHDLTLQVERYNPLIISYNVRSLAGGFYDPVFNAQWSRDNASTESGEFSPLTGAPIPGSKSQFDTTSGLLSGNLPTGMRYELYHDLVERRNSSPFFQTNLLGNTILNKNVSDNWGADAGIRVNQPLLRDFWTDFSRTAIKLRRKDKRISDLNLEQIVHDTVRLIVEAYYTFVGRLEAVKVAEADLQVKRQNFDETRRKVEVGTFAPLDEKKAQSEVSLAEGVLIKARNDAADAESTLKSRISADFVNQIGVRIQPTDKLLVLPVTLDLPTSFHTALDKRPNLQAQRETLERQNIQLKYNFNQLFPRLDVFASWGVNGLDGHLDGAIADLERKDFQQDRYGILFSMPLTLARERNELKGNKVIKAQLIKKLELAEQNVTFDVESSIRAVSSAYQLVFTSRDGVFYAEQNLAAEQKKFAAGKGTSFFVLDAASKLAKARNDAIQAELDYNLALNKLAHAEGTILEQRKIDFEAVRYPVAPTAK